MTRPRSIPLTCLPTTSRAIVTDTNYGVDLLIVGSRPEANDGRTLLSAQAENAIVGTAAPVLVVARGVAVDFQSELYIA